MLGKQIQVNSLLYAVDPETKQLVIQLPDSWFPRGDLLSLTPREGDVVTYDYSDAFGTGDSEVLVAIYRQMIWTDVIHLGWYTDKRHRDNIRHYETILRPIHMRLLSKKVVVENFDASQLVGTDDEIEAQLYELVTVTRLNPAIGSDWKTWRSARQEGWYTDVKSRVLTSMSSPLESLEVDVPCVKVSTVEEAYFYLNGLLLTLILIAQALMHRLSDINKVIGVYQAFVGSNAVLPDLTKMDYIMAIGGFYTQRRAFGLLSLLFESQDLHKMNSLNEYDILAAFSLGARNARQIRSVINSMPAEWLAGISETVREKVTTAVMTMRNTNV